MMRALLLTLVLALPAAAADPLKIGTREAPPFSMRGDDGMWQGVSIDLLAALAQRLNVHYDLVDTDLASMIDDVADGKLNASIAAMSVTAERERRVDFSHPYFQTGLGVAVPKLARMDLRALVDALTSTAFLGTVGLLTALLVVIGALAWVVERRRNPQQFEPDPRRGLLSGFWWAAVTMTTVGYGDKTPVTVPGRLLGVFWMYSALILTAVFTAQLAAKLTSHTIGGSVSHPADLARLRVGNVADASSVDPLRALGVRPIGYPSVADGLAALTAGDIDAFVHDRPILVWVAQTARGVEVTGVVFAPQSFAIVLPEGTPFREQINRELLAFMSTPEWSAIQRRYLGE